MKRRICVVTGTRAEFGLLKWVIQGLSEEPDVDLQIVATGMHLSPEFGLTFKEIEAAGFKINERVEMLLSADTSSSVTKSIGLGLIGFSDVFERLRPHIVVVLGDRFEILAASTAALVAGVPIAHLHGGETTEGAFDEAIRHSITKMSHFHFVAAEEYRKRVIQLGENPARVYLVGGLGVDAIKKMKLLGRHELEESLNFRFGKKNLLITFHPVTLETSTAPDQVAELLEALSQLTDTSLIFTMPNADTGGREIRTLLESFVTSNANARLYSSLGQLKYLSCMQFVDGVIGNSSSGLAEAPSMGIGTVNIGDRQKGRLKASTVIDCAPIAAQIRSAIDKLYSPGFQNSLRYVRNPYGDGGASDRIVSTLKACPLEGILKKSFYDLNLQNMIV